MTECEYRLHTTRKRIETAQTRIATLVRMLKATPEDDLRSAQEQLARRMATRDDVLA